jgi:IS30 family transposase
MSEVIVPTCTKDMARTIVTLRKNRWSFKRIALKVGRSTSTVTRYYRVYVKFGESAFADSQ